MPMALLTVLEWVGPDADHKEHDDPSWELVEDVIRRLNGQERNDLYLYASLPRRFNSCRFFKGASSFGPAP